MPPYRIGNVFMLIKFTCNGNTHLFVVFFLRERERGTFVAGPCPQVSPQVVCQRRRTW